MAILEQVARSDDGLTLQELSIRLGIKPTTIHNLLRTLISKGFAEKVPHPVRYRVGPAVGELVALRDRNSLLRRVPAVLTDLFNEFKDASVVFSQATGGDIQKVMRIGPERPGVLERPGVSMHPYGTASALLFQSLWPEEERVAYRRRYPFWEYGAYTWGEERRFEACIAETRRNGYAALRLEKAGLFTAAVPVTGARGEVKAVVGATLPIEKDSEERRRQLIENLRKAAETLSG